MNGAPGPMTLWMEKNSRKLMKMATIAGDAAVSAELK